MPSVIPKNVGEKIKRALSDQEKDALGLDARFFEPKPAEKEGKIQDEQTKEYERFLRRVESIQQKNRNFQNSAETFHDVKDIAAAENFDFFVQFRIKTLRYVPNKYAIKSSLC